MKKRVQNRTLEKTITHALNIAETSLRGADRDFIEACNKKSIILCYFCRKFENNVEIKKYIRRYYSVATREGYQDELDCYLHTKCLEELMTKVDKNTKFIEDSDE